MSKEPTMNANAVKLINATPHEVVFFKEEDTVFSNEVRGRILKESDVRPYLVLPPSGICPRCSNIEDTTFDPIGGVPVIAVRYGELEGIPDEKEGTFYITSVIAAQAARDSGRYDVLTIVRPVRNQFGCTIGCTAVGL